MTIDDRQRLLAKKYTSLKDNDEVLGVVGDVWLQSSSLASILSSISRSLSTGKEHSFFYVFVSTWHHLDTRVCLSVSSAVTSTSNSIPILYTNCCRRDRHFAKFSSTTDSRLFRKCCGCNSFSGNVVVVIAFYGVYIFLPMA